nr:glycosyltransferase [Helicobacter himalayensis]
MSKISIVIPTYNVERYIARCLESCINQTFSDIEILIVDDCGSDDSIKIAQSFADKDSRIRIIHNAQNLGTFNARLEGIKHALGEYLLFLDADDYLELNACEMAWGKVAGLARNMSDVGLVPVDEDLRPDIVFFGMRYEPPTWQRVSPKVITNPLRNEEVLYEVFAHCATPPWHIWAKLYKASRIALARDLIVAHMGEDSRLTMAEDVLKSFYICALATSSVGIKDKLYVYCSSDTSITRKIDTQTRDKKISDITRVINEIKGLDSVPQIANNPAFKPAQAKTIKILQSVIELEHRYDSPEIASGGGALSRCLSPYLRACLASLKYYRKWQTYVRILAYLLSFGKKKI